MTKTNQVTATKKAASAKIPEKLIKPAFFKKSTIKPFFPANAPLQMKMSVSQPSDKSEQEADHMAEKVMKMTSPLHVKKIRSGRIQRKADERISRCACSNSNWGASEKIQRVAKGNAQRNHPVPQLLHSKTQNGQALSNDVRHFMEPRFKADFSNIRIHNDPHAHILNEQLHARAFTYKNHIFFGKNQYQPSSHSGKQLIAHELTHTIQQGHAIHRSAMVTTSSPVSIQPSLLPGEGMLLNSVADKANLIPGFRLLTLILGFNPINSVVVERNAGNILRALIELMPLGSVITQVLEKYGVFDKITAWFNPQVSQLSTLLNHITNDIAGIITALNATNLSESWESAKRLFTQSIGQLSEIAQSIARGILELVKEEILHPLALMAKDTPGYELLCAVLGRDPITNEIVTPTPEVLIGGFLKLIGQDEVWENIQKGNAIPRAYAWFQQTLVGIRGYAHSIPIKLIELIKGLTFNDLISIAQAFSNIVSAFASIVTEFSNWAKQQVLQLLEIIFSVVAPSVLPYIKKGKDAFETILKNPVAFVGNLVNAGRLGFSQFANNITTHLKTSLIKWLVGPLANAGVYIPTAFNLKEIVKLVLSVFNLTWEYLRSKLAKIIPEPVLMVLEKTADVVVTLVKEGPAAAWEQIKGEITELKEQMIAKITEMVSIEVVKAAVIKIASLINPASAVVQAIISIYNTISFFIEKINQIGAVVASFIDSISAIANGKIAAAANRVETTMANTLVLIISFMAKLAGIGNIPEKLVGIVKKLRLSMDKGIDKIVAWLGALLKRLGAKIKNVLFPPKPFDVDGESHRIYQDGDKVMVASVPFEINFIRNKLIEQNKDNAAARKDLAQLANYDKELKVMLKNDKTNDQTKIDQLVNNMINILKKYHYGTDKKAKMKEVTVSFDKFKEPNYKSSNPCKKSQKSEGRKEFIDKEYNRQINMQQSELSQMQVGKWQERRSKFMVVGRKTSIIDPDNKSADSDDNRARQYANFLKNSKPEIIKPLIAEIPTIKLESVIKADDDKLLRIAKVLLKNAFSDCKHVLHRLDQVAGGRANEYGDEKGILGDGSINSFIGTQWKTRVRIVDEGTKDVKKEAKLEVKLEINK